MTNGENTISIIQGQITLVLLGRFCLLSNTSSCAYKYFVQLWSRLIEKCGLYPANKVKNSNCQ